MFDSQASKILAMLVIALVAVSGAGCTDDGDGDNNNPPVPDRNAMMPNGTMPSATLTIKGAGLDLSFTFLQLANRTDLVNGTFNLLNSAGTWTNSTYVGVSLFNLISTASVPADGGLVKFSAADGYSKKIALPLLQDYQDDGNDTIIGLASNGAFLGDKGPMRLVSSSLLGKFWISNLTSIEFIPWELSISGTVSATYNVTTISAMAQFSVNTTKNDIVTKYTGVNLTDLLVAAGATGLNTTALTFTGYDGYEMSINYTDITDAFTTDGNASMIAFMTDDVAMTSSTGGPFKNVISGLAGKYWVSGLVSIEINPLL